MMLVAGSDRTDDQDLLDEHFTFHISVWQQAEGLDLKACRQGDGGALTATAAPEHVPSARSDGRSPLAPSAPSECRIGPPS